MILYSQRDPRWASHPLGWGPALGTIGQYGCFDSVLAMIATDTGHVLNPAQLDEAFTAAKIFARDPTGTFDLLPDDALARVFPDRYLVSSFAGFRGDLIRSAVPSKDTYAVLWISTPSVPTHFVLAAAVDGLTIADPWTGSYGRLAGYGGPAAVHKTVLVQALAAAPPVPPAPVPTPTPPPPQPTPAPSKAPAPSTPQPQGGSTPVAVNPTPAAPVTPAAPGDHGLGVAPGPDPGPPPEVDIPEPAPVAEAGVTTSEWKAMLGFAAQELAVGTTTIVGKLGGHIDNQTALLIGGFELGLIFLGGAYILSRGIRKLGTTA